ncbi:MAG: hypothetical protein NXH75_08555 [Halobacteriovoraceae bacterium]|nr:hypothetical protein [Halobacteriovoraceae bacterium]
MGKRFKHELLFQSRSLTLYFLFSSLAGFLMVAGLSYTHGLNGVLSQYPLCLTFFVSTIYVAIYTSELRAALSLLKPLTNFFLVQFFLLLGCSFELKHAGPLFMSTLPLVAALFTIQSHWFNSQQEKFQRGASLLGIVSFAYLFFFLNYGREEKNLITVSTLAGFIMWQVGTIYLANREWLRLSRDLLFKRLKTFNKTDIPSHPINRERYFFHDVINHTHGINLMLRTRVMKNRGLTYEETLSLVTEVGALQSLVQDHYGLTHKNLKDSWQYKPFGFIKNMAINVVENFLPESEVDSFYLFKGTLKEDSPHDPEISFVAFHRIFTNLIKNCSEANAKRVEILFEGKADCLLLTVKNDVYRNRSSGYELGHSLAKMIQRDNSGPQLLSGVGLEAIESLCQEWGGEFRFFIQEGTWVSEVTFPFKEALDLENSEIPNSTKSDKKAA